MEADQLHPPRDTAHRLPCVKGDPDATLVPLCPPSTGGTSSPWPARGVMRHCPGQHSHPAGSQYCTGLVPLQPATQLWAGRLLPLPALKAAAGRSGAPPAPKQLTFRKTQRKKNSLRSALCGRRVRKRGCCCCFHCVHSNQGA